MAAACLGIRVRRSSCRWKGRGETEARGRCCSGGPGHRQQEELRVPSSRMQVRLPRVRLSYPRKGDSFLGAVCRRAHAARLERPGKYPKVHATAEITREMAPTRMHRLLTLCYSTTRRGPLLLSRTIILENCRRELSWDMSVCFRAFLFAEQWSFEIRSSGGCHLSHDCGKPAHLWMWGGVAPARDAAIGAPLASRMSMRRAIGPFSSKFCICGRPTSSLPRRFDPGNCFPPQICPSERPCGSRRRQSRGTTPQAAPQPGGDRKAAGCGVTGSSCFLATFAFLLWLTGII